MTQKELDQTKKIFPWVAGLTDDLIFFIAIDILFLTTVRGLNAFQISLMTTIACIGCIILQRPIIWVIKKIGNTWSLRLGIWTAISACILLGFGSTYISVLLYAIMHNVATLLINMRNAILKNNLTFEKKNDEFIIYQNKVSTIYALATMITSFCSGFLFNINVYLPIIMNITLLLICLGASFYIKEVPETKKKKTEKEMNIKTIPRLFLFIMVCYGLFYGVLNLAHDNGKILTQFELEQFLNIETVAQYIALIVTISRIVRLASNLAFKKMFIIFKNRISLILVSGLALALILILLGSIMNFGLMPKVLLMGTGFFFLLAVRDPFKNYMITLVLDYCQKEKQQEYLSYLELSRKIAALIISTGVTLMLLNIELMYVIVVLLVLAMIDLFLVRKLYTVISRRKYEKFTD